MAPTEAGLQADSPCTTLPGLRPLPELGLARAQRPSTDITSGDGPIVPGSQPGPGRVCYPARSRGAMVPMPPRWRRYGPWQPSRSLRRYDEEWRATETLLRGAWRDPMALLIAGRAVCGPLPHSGEHECSLAVRQVPSTTHTYQSPIRRWGKLHQEHSTVSHGRGATPRLAGLPHNAGAALGAEAHPTNAPGAAPDVAIIPMPGRARTSKDLRRLPDTPSRSSGVTARSAAVCKLERAAPPGGPSGDRPHYWTG